VIVAFFFLAVTLLIFAVEMVRAQVLPVVPLTLLAAGPVFGMATVAVLAVVPGDGWLSVVVTLVPVTVALMWLGWFMWREPAVDRRGVGPLVAQ
jgi:hypothetical protein